MRLNSDIIKVTTQRFLLKQLITDDVSDRYLSWLNEEESPYIEYGKNHSTMEDLKVYVSERERKRDVLFLGIFTKKKKHIGNIKYEPINFINKSAILGILIGDRYWKGKGVANEVIKGSANFLYEKYGVKTIRLMVNHKNQPAKSAYKKIGFTITNQSEKDATMILQL